MALKYFGTDGMRGSVGTLPMTTDFCRKVGRGLGKFLRAHNQAKPITVMIGRDTRESGVEFENAIREGLEEHQIMVFSFGVVPTPAVSQSVKELSADLGIMITASHNPASDNGIKLFDNCGYKFKEESEAVLEKYFDDELAIDPEVKEPSQAFEHDALGFYINYLRALMHQGCLSGWKIALDLSHGATVKSTPAVLAHFGAELFVSGDQPDGMNINDGVGSEHPEGLCALVKAKSVDIGIAHDGDGDRVLFVDELGDLVTGEEVIGILALHALSQKRLAKNTLVTTIHSNTGLDKAIQAAGGQVERVGVGDRNILYRMLEQGYSIGGESSGHVILLDHATTGDGLLTAIRLIEVMMQTKQKLSELRQQIELFPQVTKNLKVADKIPLADCKHLSKAMQAVEKAFKGNGRLLVRYSGTEPKLRLLVEGPSLAILEKHMETLATAAAQDLEIL